MTKSIVIEKIVDLLKSKFKKPIEMDNLDIINIPLISNTFRLDIIELIYLFFEICLLFKIKMDGDDLKNYNFLTINGISNIVMNKMESNEISHY